MPPPGTTTVVNRPSPSTSNSKHLATVAYVDEQIHKADRHITSEFEGQHDYHEVKYGRLESKIEEMQQELQNIKAKIQTTNENISSVMSANRNRLAIRGVDTIWPLSTGSNLSPCFPRNVTAFWKLKEPHNRSKLVRLLQSLDYQDFGSWAKYDDAGEPIEQTHLETIPADSSPLEYHVGQFPLKAHKTVADILFLDYNTIKENMDQFSRYKARPTRSISGRKRDQGTYDDGYIQQPNKFPKTTISDISSLTEEIHTGQPGDYRPTELSSPSDEDSQESSSFGREGRRY